MLSKTFVFSKIQKSIEKIETDLNTFLSKHEFKYATQNESTLKGKFVITLFAVKKASTVRAKVFKDQHINELDGKVNVFLAKHGMKFVTQTFVGSSVYTVIFFDSKATGEDDQTTTDTNGQN